MIKICSTKAGSQLNLHKDIKFLVQVATRMTILNFRLLNLSLLSCKLIAINPSRLILSTGGLVAVIPPSDPQVVWSNPPMDYSIRNILGFKIVRRLVSSDPEQTVFNAQIYVLSGNRIHYLQSSKQSYYRLSCEASQGQISRNDFRFCLCNAPYFPVRCTYTDPLSAQRRYLKPAPSLPHHTSAYYLSNLA